MKALLCGVGKEMIPGYSRGKVASTGVIECIDIAVLDYWLKNKKKRILLQEHARYTVVCTWARNGRKFGGKKDKTSLIKSRWA